VNNDLDKLKKIAAVLSFEILFHYLPGETKVNHKKLRLVYSVSW
jgi:hypothetical protein